MIGVIDTHAHLTDARFNEDRADVIARAFAAGVRHIVTIGGSVEDSEAALRLAESTEGVYATAGVHPHVADGVTDTTFSRLADVVRSPRIVAIGETGLDFHYDNSDRENQRASFVRHIELAAKTDLPVVVHARSADEEVAKIIREVGWGRGVLHCFSGSRPLLDTALELGWYISFAGMITFRRWDGADLLRRVPLDRLLVETDSPYLAPVPHRGRRNEPAFVRLVVERAAELRGEDLAEVASATTENALRFYRIDPALGR